MNYDGNVMYVIPGCDEELPTESSPGLSSYVFAAY
jgi:hypothetical protein